MTDLLAPADDEHLQTDEPELPPLEPSRPLWVRVGDWLVSRPLESWVSAFVVVGAVVFTLAQLHPDLLLRNTTPTGGDMGAHVWGPAYLRDHLLPHGRLSGWAPDWYAGFPAYHYYMVVPALLVVLVDVALPYGVALKLVSVLGILTLPIAAWAFGRLAGLRFPSPELLSVAAVFFLFDETFTIYGGNVASTMAGEFSFSIALSIAVVYLGVVARGMRTGEHRALAAGLLALAGLSHLLVAFFAIVGSILWFLIYADRHRFRWMATMAPVAGAIVCFWMLPFWWRREYMTDMGYERIDEYLTRDTTDAAARIFPYSPTWNVLLTVLALIGLAGTIRWRNRAGVWLFAVAIVYALWFRFWPQNLLWNARLIPFLHLARYLLAAVGVAVVIVGLAELVTRWRQTSPRPVVFGGLAASLAVALVVLGMRLEILPGGERFVKQTASGSVTAYRWMGLENTDLAFVDDWAKWNYLGYEGRPAYGEYREVVMTMAEIGERRGCGRALWEGDNDLEAYGTPMALMLLPFWTDGCIGSMEGLFFESSATTPYHFLTSSILSQQSSRPVRHLDYESLNVSKGVRYLQLLGVRYYMAYSQAAIDQAAGVPELTEVATAGPWHIYEVAGAELVTPLTNEPAVVTGIGEHRARWLRMATEFFQDPDAWSVPLTADGPEEWQRIEFGETPEERPLEPVAVSDIDERDDRISFRVDRVGVPVLVKTSYFPNWEVSGAEGPWRVAPNLMLVVPTDNEVSLHYGRTPVDVASAAVSVLGLVALGFLARRPKVEYPVPEEPRGLEAWWAPRPERGGVDGFAGLTEGATLEEWDLWDFPDEDGDSSVVEELVEPTEPDEPRG